MLQCRSPEAIFFNKSNPFTQPGEGRDGCDGVDGRMDRWIEGWIEGEREGGRERQTGTEAWQTGLMIANSTGIEIPSFLPGGRLWATGESGTKSEVLEKGGERNTEQG